MLDADVKERVCDLAWELGYDWDDKKWKVCLRVL